MENPERIFVREKKIAKFKIWLKIIFFSPLTFIKLLIRNGKKQWLNVK